MKNPRLPCYIRPVGEVISLTTENTALAYEGYQKEFYASGTMALQAALIIAKAQRKNVKKPQCLIAGYGCPDLISACVGAGIDPIIIDTDANSPFPTLSDIKSASSEEVVAIVLVHFLGLDPPKILIEGCKNLGLFIIEDRAQSFLAPMQAKKLFGDAVIFSFGKGKPVSLLGGGLLLVRDGTPFQAISDPALNGLGDKLKNLAKIIAYNILIKPRIYPLLLKVPGLSIGETHYHPPLPLTAMDELRLSLLPANVAVFNQNKGLSAPYICKRLSGVMKLTGCSVLINEISDAKMLRLPILAPNKELRDKLVGALCESGIGSTTLYQTALPYVAGLPSIPAPTSELKNAKDFASRLFTLPSHSDVTEQTLAAIIATIESLLMPKDQK